MNDISNNFIETFSKQFRTLHFLALRLPESPAFPTLLSQNVGITPFYDILWLALLFFHICFTKPKIQDFIHPILYDVILIASHIDFQHVSFPVIFIKFFCYTKQAIPFVFLAMYN